MPRSTKRYLQSYLKNPQWNFSLAKDDNDEGTKKNKKNVLICALLRIK